MCGWVPTSNCSFATKPDLRTAVKHVAAPHRVVEQRELDLLLQEDVSGGDSAVDNVLGVEVPGRGKGEKHRHFVMVNFRGEICGKIKIFECVTTLKVRHSFIVWLKQRTFCIPCAKGRLLCIPWWPRKERWVRIKACSVVNNLASFRLHSRSSYVGTPH